MPCRLLTALCWLAGCDATIVDSWPDLAAAQDMLPSPDLPRLPDLAPAPILWPNAQSRANSDPWLVQNHTSITKMQPRVLILNFDNDTTSPTQMSTLHKLMPADMFNLLQAAFREGSRYHGYSTASAAPFIDYQLEKIIDLTDATYDANAPYHNSTLLPRRGNQVDYSTLFSPSYAYHYGYADPQNPGQWLGLCDLFRRGIVNELWVNVDQDNYADVTPREWIGVKRAYDANDQLQPGFAYSGFDSNDTTAVEACGVTVRGFGINPSRGPGCMTHGAGHGFETMFDRLPSQVATWRRFSNNDLDTRLGQPFSSWYMCTYFDWSCIAYTGPNSLVWAQSSLGTGVIPVYDQGCGNDHFPPNARSHYDYSNPAPQPATCEHFGLRDGPNGQDLKTPFDSSLVSGYESRFGDCGGGWMTYWFQSFPGFANLATDASGKPIKNWWAYLYY